jgi:hypothetical protein
VPRISEFYGIVIAMYYREHGVAHFHATYAGETAVVGIETGEVITATISCTTGTAPASRLHWIGSSRSRSIGVVDLAAHLHRVTKVEVVGDHRLRVAFDDGTGGEVDASGWEWLGVFAPLRDPEFFEKVELDAELGTIVWPNGADIAPETLHSWVGDANRLSA